MPPPSFSQARSWITVASIVTSSLTTGFVSAHVTYDLDADPLNQKQAPMFYGMAPEAPKARALLLVVMMVNSGILLVVKSFSLMLLGHQDKSHAAGIYLADQAIFLIIKIAQGDFHHYLPFPAGGFGVFCSLLARVMTKFVSDFTAIVYLRHPNELGGELRHEHGCSTGALC